MKPILLTGAVVVFLVAATTIVWAQANEGVPNRMTDLLAEISTKLGDLLTAETECEWEEYATSIELKESPVGWWFFAFPDGMPNADVQVEQIQFTGTTSASATIQLGYRDRDGTHHSKGQMVSDIGLGSWSVPDMGSGIHSLRNPSGDLVPGYIHIRGKIKPANC